MKTKGFCYKLQDSQKTMFITNLDVSDSVKIGIINYKFEGLYAQAKLDESFVIPRSEFCELVARLNEIANDMKSKAKKEQKFIADFESELKEKKTTKKGSKKK